MIRRSDLPDVPAAGGAYSQVVEVRGLLFTAGMGPVDPATGTVAGATVAEQTHRAIDNLEAALGACGVRLDAVVKATVHLADVKRDFKEFDAAFAERFSGHLPARTTVGSSLPGILVEIDFIAVTGQGG
jgi:reactive intermediate/imine deaminase